MLFTEHNIIITYFVIALVVCLIYNVGSLLKRQLDLNCNPENHEHYDEYEWDDFITKGCTLERLALL